MRRAVAALFVLAVLPSAAAQRLEPFIPVGVVVHGAGGLSGHRPDLLELAKRRFNVIAFANGETGELRITRLTGWLDAKGSQPPDIPAAGVAAVPVPPTGRELRFRAWQAMADGARGVVFDPFPALMRNADALDAASEFADNVTRNAALYAPLRRRESTSDIRVDAPRPAVTARFLESNAALVLIALNPTADTHRVTFKFSTEIPEAIWQNMETGAAVNFVASAEGPTYTRTFTPFDVMVLMIRKQYK